MPIVVSDFPSLTDDLQSIYNEVAKTKVAAMKGKKIFDVRDTKRRTFDHLILHGMEGIKEVTPGQDLPNILSEEGDTITWTQRYFGGIASITKAMRKFDLYNQIESLVRSLAVDSFDKIDQSFADVILHGFSASSYTDVYGSTTAAVGPDGLALFHTGHTNPLTTNTFANIITSNPVLSRAAIITARVQAATYKDPNDINRPVNLDTLIYAPSNADLAERIVLSDLIPGSANNDKNTLKGKIKNMIEWERLETRSDGTDTSAYWFMADSTRVGETLQALFAERPSLDAPDQVYVNKNWEYSLDYFYTIGIGYAAYLYGSSAAGS